MFRGRMNASSKILQWKVYRSWCADSYSLRSDVLPPRYSSREETLSCDPQVTIACLHALCRFRLEVGTCFTNSSFAGRCEHSFSLSDYAEEPIVVSSYMALSGKSTILGLGPSRVSRIVFSFAKSASLYCTLHLSQRRGGWVLVYPRKCLSRVVYAFLWLHHVILY